jgi:hypothetical protein
VRIESRNPMERETASRKNHVLGYVLTPLEVVVKVAELPIDGSAVSP